MKIEKDDLYRLYVVEELNQTEIGLIYSCDRKNIDYYLKKFGIPKRTRKESVQSSIKKRLPSMPTLEQLEQHIEQGLFLQEICDIYNISRARLYNFTKEHGLNFKNHETQRAAQSERLKKDNPVPKGSKRPKEVMQASKKAQKEIYEKKKRDIEQNGDLKQYCKVARHAAYFHYGRKTPEGLHIDHLFSLKDGYKNNVPIDIISHPNNLRLITAAENLKKGSKSIITLEQLYRFTK